MSTPGVCLNIMKERQEGDGVGTLTNPEMFLNQDFNLLHQYYLVRGWRYIDDMFPPDINSIGRNLLTPDKMALVEWIRPTKLVPNPLLVVDGVSRFDFAQGEVGNCWFLAALGALTFQGKIMKNVFPSGQSFQKDYAGIFHFRFWRFGKWVDVVIDDKLPTINGQLIFVHAKNSKTPQSPRAPTEFWPALMEKAYAKVCGSYEDMKSGNVSEALLDFTGGVHMSVNPSTSPQGLWDLIYRAGASNSLMGCGTPGKSDFNKQLDNGLVEGHAYTVTGITAVTSQDKEVQLVRLFNPWGGTEWNGDWSDNSPLWKTVSANEQKNYLKAVEDGEFWMSMEDFCRTFSMLDICCLCPDFLNSTSKCHWSSKFHDGQWLAGSSAGGRPECDTFYTNPQYRVKIGKLDKGCEEQTQEPNILVSLLQKPDKRNRRLIRNFSSASVFSRSAEFFTIAEIIPPGMKSSRGKLEASFFKMNRPVAYTKVMYDSREVMGCFKLEPGEYITVPHTYDPKQSASFILGILSKMETHTEESFSMKMSKMNMTESDGSVAFSRQMSDQYKDLNAEQLQKLLNERFVEEDAQHTGGFSVEVCHSIIALMDHSLTGTLDADELFQLLNKVKLYKETFFRMDKNRDGILSLTELRNAVDGTGVRVSESLLKLMALRYGDSTGRISMESFICLAIRLDRMGKIFNKLADGQKLQLKEDEWLRLTMYS